MKKTINIESMFPDGDFYNSFRQVREAGFEYVEFGDWTGLDLTRVKDLVREYHLSVAAIGGCKKHSLCLPEKSDEFLEHLSQSIAIAKDFGCSNLILHFDARAESSSANGFGRVAAVTRALLDATPRAERAKMTLHVKPFEFVPDLAGGLSYIPSVGEIVGVVNSPAIRLLYDVTRMQAVEGGIVRALRKYRDFIGYVHVGGSLDCPEYCPECCEMDLRVVRRVLTKELFYNGFVGFEFRPVGDPAACLEAARNF